MFDHVNSLHRYPINYATGWWLSPTPLKNDGVKVSWDDEMSIYYGKIKNVLQTTNQLIYYGYSNTIILPNQPGNHQTSIIHGVYLHMFDGSISAKWKLRLNHIKSSYQSTSSSVEPCKIPPSHPIKKCLVDRYPVNYVFVHNPQSPSWYNPSTYSFNLQATIIYQL